MTDPTEDTPWGWVASAVVLLVIVSVLSWNCGYEAGFEYASRTVALMEREGLVVLQPLAWKWMNIYGNAPRHGPEYKRLKDFGTSDLATSGRHDDERGNP